MILGNGVSSGTERNVSGCPKNEPVYFKRNHYPIIFLALSRRRAQVTP